MLHLADAHRPTGAVPSKPQHPHRGARAALGLSATLVASPTAFTVLRVAGTGYLGWLAVTLSAVFAALYIGWSTCYVLALVRIGHLVRNARVRSRVEGITGAALMLLAVRLATTAGP